MAYNPRNDRWRIVIATVKENVATASRKKDRPSHPGPRQPTTDTHAPK